MKKLTRRKSLSRLTEQVAKVQVDSLDPDILSYISAFMDQFSSLSRMERFDLTTPEGALAALAKLKKHELELKSQATALEALKRLLQQQTPQGPIS